MAAKSGQNFQALASAGALEGALVRIGGQANQLIRREVKVDI
jgi:hypothetical protein